MNYNLIIDELIDYVSEHTVDNEDLLFDVNLMKRARKWRNFIDFPYNS